jgi:Alr-MurF fusion protein
MATLYFAPSTSRYRTDHAFTNMIYFSHLEDITGGKNIALHKNLPVTSLLTDSRKAVVNEGAVFFAIRGDRHDGHQYILDLYDNGIRQFVVETAPPVALPQCNIIVVPSAINALQDIAQFHRKQFDIPVIGITGSNGKTIIKEWLFQMLSRWETIVKNPGSYNSQIGVPLSVWQLHKECTLGIFEAGISRTGEMERLERVIAPSYGILSNIGSAHDEGFSTRTEKAREKLKLFSNVKALVYCRDHAMVHQLLEDLKIPAINWSVKESDSDVVIRHMGELTYSVQWRGMHFPLTLPFADPASSENCFHAVTLMLILGYDGEKIQTGINTLRTVPMRLELKEGINNCQIIDDTYNNDLAGLEISLQFLSHQHQKKKKTLILSDILQSGMKDSDLVKKLEDLVMKYGVNRFIGIGKVLSHNEDFFPEDSSFFTDTVDFLNNFDVDTLHQEVILVKGARTFAFEKIVHRLQRKVHGTVMEIDLGALVHNFNYIKASLKKSTKVMVMVKAFAYGSGSNEVANLLQYHQADYLGVAYADEGVDLRKNNISLPVMVMNPSPESFESIVSHNLEPEVYSFRLLTSLVRFLQGKNCKIHIKIDTGMHRLGFELTDLENLSELLTKHRNLTVASIFSHLAGADDEQHDEFSAQQAETFLHCANFISSRLGYKPVFHLLNSPGILRLPQFQFDMVRLGIGLYGIDPTGKLPDVMKPVATLKTVISQIKYIPAGESIGYGRRGRAEKDISIATIAIGYADGFSRAFSRGVGSVMLNGKKVPVIGNVCMDMTMIDITGVEAKEGDEVEVFGKQLSIGEVAERIKTIPYEILTSTSERVKRIFVSEGI